MNTAPGAFDSRAAFEAAVRWGFETAVARDARRIVCCDPDFAAWPLDDPTLHALLLPWLKRPQRRLVLVASSYDELPRRHPRFTAWRMPWVHAIDAWLPADRDVVLPNVLVDDAHLVVELRDAQRFLGRAAFDAAAAQRWRDRLDAIVERGERGFGVRALGL